METLSLKDLKAENATETDTEDTEAIEEEKGTTLTDDYVEEVEEPEAAEEEAEEGQETTEAEADAEDWMQSEEADSNSSDFKPDAEAKKRRVDFKNLKTQVKQKDDELAKLKAEVESLKQPVQSDSLPPRPKREDFDFDDDKYDAAVDAWNEQKMQRMLDTHAQTSTTKAAEKQQAEAAQKRVSENVNSHYEKAGELVNSGKVSEDAYAKSDSVVRHELERVFPGQGDAVTDQLISTLHSLGDGSEKVMYSLGVNRAKLERLSSLMATDQLQAVAYLGKLQAETTTPGKRKSNAPKPGADVKGEAKAGGPAESMRKAYEKAGKEGDIQARISIKRKAKKEGIDVSNWR